MYPSTDRFFVAGAVRAWLCLWLRRVVVIVALGAILAALSGCMTRPRMVPMIIDGKPGIALAVGENPEPQVDWIKTGGLTAGGVALLLGSIEYYSKNKGGRTGGDIPSAFTTSERSDATAAAVNVNGDNNRVTIIVKPVECTTP